MFACIFAGSLFGIGLSWTACADSLGDFKYPEESQGSQHADAEGSPRFNRVPDHLTNASHDHLRAQRSHQCESDTPSFIPWCYLPRNQSSWMKSGSSSWLRGRTSLGTSRSETTPEIQTLLCLFGKTQENVVIRIHIYKNVWISWWGGGGGGGLTEGLCEPHRLVIVDDGHAQSVQAHHAENDPVEALSFHHATDEEADPFLFAPEVGGAVHFAAAFHAGSAERRARRSCREEQRDVTAGFWQVAPLLLLQKRSCDLQD